MFVCPECGASRPDPGPCTADHTPTMPNADDPLLGQSIGPYRIARLLGIGGMGRVYKGVQPQIGSRVAIKVLSRECSDRRDVVGRFFDEARAVNLIRHESIVNVLDLAVLPDGRPYIVMEYLDGVPLSAIIEDARHSGRPLPLGGIARLAAEVLDALGAAHAKGIVHRDLKPDNIFVTPSGRAKVLDFGIAKLQPELGGSSTQTGSLLGTPHYMSPEQAGGRHVDTRADLYAMGVILFECATLRKPFVADALFDLLRMHIEATPPSPRALRPDMPPDLEAVIFTALAKQPDQRFGSAQAMSNALQHATGGLAQDQWAAVLPSASARPSGWQPTPPASWARHGQQATTVSSGQVTRSSGRPRSRKALWIGGGIFAAGAIAVGAVVATGGDKTSASSGSGSQVAETPSPSPSPPPSPPPSPDPSPPPPPSPEVPAMGDLLGGMDAEEVHEMLGAMFDDAEPDVIAMWPKEWQDAKKKYKTWDKVPKAVKARMAGAGLAKVQNLTANAGKQINNALAGVDDTHAPPPKREDWFARHDVDPPADRAHVAPDAFVAYAVKEAKKYVPDAELVRIDADGVGADGTIDLGANLKIGEPGVIVRFFSKSHGAHPCEFRVEVDPSGAEMYETPDASGKCTVTPVRMPRCKTGAVLATGRKRAKDPATGPASLIYRLLDGHAVWDVSFGMMNTVRLPDDC